MALMEADSKAMKRGGVGGSLLKTGAALATGGISAGLDAATGGVAGNLGAIGRKLGSVFQSAPAAGGGGALPDSATAMSRRYYAMK